MLSRLAGLPAQTICHIFDAAQREVVRELPMPVCCHAQQEEADCSAIMKLQQHVAPFMIALTEARVWRWIVWWWRRRRRGGDTQSSGRWPVL